MTRTLAAWLALSLTAVPLQAEPAPPPHAPAPLPHVVVEKLDSGRVAGRLQSLDDKQLSIQHDDAKLSLPLADLLRIDVSTNTATTAATTTGTAPALVVELNDGSQFPANRVALTEGRATVEFAQPLTLPDRNQLLLGTEALKSLRFATDGVHDETWSRLSREVAASDVLVVYRKKEASIDGVECVIEAITPQAVTVNLGDENIDVPLEKVHGVLFAQLEAATGRNAIVVTGSHRLRLLADRLRLGPSGDLIIESAQLGAVAAPVDQIAQIDFSADRVRWLSELTVIKHSWRPYFGHPAGLTSEHRRSGMANNRSLVGDRLKIVDQKTYPRIGSVQEFSSGIALRSGTETLFALPADFNWFAATAGIDPRTAQQGAVLLRIFADGDLLYEHTVDGSAAVDVKAPLRGATNLRVVVDYGDNLDLGDCLHLGAARITK